MSYQNRQVILTARPNTDVTSEHFSVVKTDVPERLPGQVLVKNIYASIDPAMKGWVKEAKTYVDPVEIGAVMRAITVGQVIESSTKSLKPGSFVTGLLGLQDYAVCDASQLRIVDPDKAPLPAYCGGLGMTGHTAYFGMLEIGRPQAGDTVVVSSAAGATGSVAGQIARIKGSKVIGIAGGKDKCAMIENDLRFDSSIDYKSGDIYKSIQEKCPNGIDIYFDNVGGRILDAVLMNMNKNGKIVLCGAIAQANGDTEGVKNLLQLAFKHVTIEGFVVFEYQNRFEEATDKLSTWLQDGKLVLPQQIEPGLDRFPELLNMLFAGHKNGKLILQISEEKQP